MIDKIVAGEYIDFDDLPPAIGFSKAVPPYLEGQVDRQLHENRFKTWSRFFAVFAAVVIIHDPSRAGDLMAYSYSIAAMAKKYPSP